MSTLRERHAKASSLAAIIGACIGKRTTIELRNEAFVTGKVVHSDGFMNVSLEQVEMIDASGAQLNFENFFVQNRLIRYVQIPSSIDIQKALEQQTSMSAGVGRGRGRCEISKQRLSILAKKDQRRQEDIRNAVQMGKAMELRMSGKKDPQ